MKPKRFFSPDDDKYIRENYLKLTDKELGKRFRVTATIIHNYRLENGLVKYNSQGEKKIIESKDGLFKVGKGNWIM